MQVRKVITAACLLIFLILLPFVQVYAVNNQNNTETEEYKIKNEQTIDDNEYTKVKIDNTTILTGGAISPEVLNRGIVIAIICTAVVLAVAIVWVFKLR